MSLRTRSREEDNNANGPPQKRTKTILDLYDDIFWIISNYMNFNDLYNFKSTCKRFNGLKIKRMIWADGDVQHRHAHKCGRYYKMACKRYNDHMFLLIFFFLLI